MLPKRVKSLLRLPTADSAAAWCHASPKDENVLRLRRIPFDKRRRYEDKSLEQIAADHPGWKQFSFGEAGRLINLPVDTFAVDEPTAWLLVAERMERRINSPPKRRLPVTEMRFLYDWLRQAPIGIRAAVARGFADSPAEMVSLCQRSQKRFASYQNSDPFRPERDEGPLADVAEVKKTRHFVTALQKHVGSEIAVVDPLGQNLGFYYVDREIDPRTTRDGVFETGELATRSGTGGMDLLLASAIDRIPVVGELKIERDMDPFFGLVQALMYAVELCTPHQFARLQQSYPEQFGGRVDRPRADVCLILLRAPENDLHKQIMWSVERLASGLYRKKSFASIIRRLVCLEASFSGSAGLSLSSRFAFGENTIHSGQVMK